MDGNQHLNADSRPCILGGCADLSDKKELRQATPFSIYELLISGLGNCGMIQLINACGERVCM